MAPSAWYIVIFFLIMFMLLQYMFLLFNEAGVRELYNPYDIFGVWLGEPSFGPRKFGCNQYQQLSAGIDVDSSVEGAPTVKILQTIFYGMVVVSALIVEGCVFFPGVFGRGNLGQKMLFYVPMVILLLGGVNLLFSSYGQLYWHQTDHAKFSKHICFDFIGTVSQTGFAPRQYEDGISPVWDAQVSLNNIFGSLVILAIIWTIVDVQTKPNPGITTKSITEIFGSDQKFNWFYLSFVSAIYYVLFLSVTIGALHNKYPGYPTEDGKCTKTVKLDY